MPLVGLGLLLHVLVACFFSLHAKRNGQDMFWLLILFACPLLGSMVYFSMIYLPGTRLERAAKRAVAKPLDPERALLQARAAFVNNPNVQNQIRLAAALQQAGQFEEAAHRYEACLNNSFTSDLEIRLGAARAWVQSQDYVRAVSHLQVLRTVDPHHCPDQVSLLMAQALAGEGCSGEARMEFEFAITRFDSLDARVEYAIWAAKWGDLATAARLKTEIDRSAQRGRRYGRALVDPTMQRQERGA